MYIPDICIDILNSLPKKYLLFSRYTSYLFYDIADRYLIKKVHTKILHGKKDFLEAVKWIPKEFGVHLNFCGKNIDNISFLKGTNIKILDIGGTSISDLSPLKGKNIEVLDIGDTSITDLSPLENAPIEVLDIGGTSITDLSPLKNTPIKELNAYATSITDISPLKGTNIEFLNINRTQISDLSSLFSTSSLKTLRCCSNTNTINLSQLEFLKKRCTDSPLK